MTIEFFSSGSDRWYWRLKARNGKIIADGAEAYTRRGDVLRAIGRFTRLLKGTVEVREV